MAAGIVIARKRARRRPIRVGRLTSFGIPDSRPRKMVGSIPSPHGSLVKAFCANCGAHHGYTLERLASEIWCLCERCEHIGRSDQVLQARRLPEDFVRTGDVRTLLR